jgi:hypothetical protein
MAFVLNRKKVERIQQQGVTVDCPLFVGIEDAIYLPSWIWIANEIKRETLDLMCHHFNRQLVQYIKAIVQYGGKASDNDIAKITGWPASTVSGRRNQLIQLGIVDANPEKKKIGPFTATNKIWSLNFDRLYDFFINKGGFKYV